MCMRVTWRYGFSGFTNVRCEVHNRASRHASQRVRGRLRMSVRTQERWPVAVCTPTRRLTNSKLTPRDAHATRRPTGRKKRINAPVPRLWTEVRSMVDHVQCSASGAECPPPGPSTRYARATDATIRSSPQGLSPPLVVSRSHIIASASPPTATASASPSPSEFRTCSTGRSLMSR